MKLPSFSLGQEWNELKRFEKLSDFERSIVFYAENRASMDYFASVNSSWSASMATVYNRDETQYDRAYEFQLENRRDWQEYRVESKLTLGESVFSESYGHLSMAIFW